MAACMLAPFLTVAVCVGVRKLHVGAPPRHGHAVAVQVALQLLGAHHAVVVGINVREQLQRHDGARQWSSAFHCCAPAVLAEQACRHATSMLHTADRSCPPSHTCRRRCSMTDGVASCTSFRRSPMSCRGLHGWRGTQFGRHSSRQRPNISSTVQQCTPTCTHEGHGISAPYATHVVGTGWSWPQQHATQPRLWV